MAAAATAFLTSTTFVAKLTEIMTMGLKFVWLLLWIMEKELAVAAAVDVVVVDAEETYLNRWRKKTKLFTVPWSTSLVSLLRSCWYTLGPLGPL